MNQTTENPQSPLQESGRQNQHWNDFYEAAWAQRARVLEDYISREGLSTFQAIEKLARLEHTHQMAFGTEGAQFKPVNFNLPPDGQLPTGTPVFRRANLLENFVDLPYYNHPIDLIIHWLELNPVDAIVELGSGFGQNLIQIFNRWKPSSTKFYAGEFTQSGQTLAKRLFESTPGMNAQSFYYDHKNPDLSITREHKSILILSIHSIEQVTHLPANFFENLTEGLQQVQGFFFEPFGYQIQTETLPYGEVSKIQSERAKDRQWNSNLMKVMIEASQRQTIQIRNIFKNIWSGDLYNPTSFAHWTRGINP